MQFFPWDLSEYWLVSEVGAGQLIFDGKIKLKNRCLITRLSERAIHFDDGSELAADVIVFATG